MPLRGDVTRVPRRGAIGEPAVAPPTGGGRRVRVGLRHGGIEGDPPMARAVIQLRYVNVIVVLVVLVHTGGIELWVGTFLHVEGELGVVHVRPGERR